MSSMRKSYPASPAISATSGDGSGMIVPSTGSPRWSRSFREVAVIARSSSGDTPEEFHPDRRNSPPVLRSSRRPDAARGSLRIADQHPGEEHEHPAHDDLEKRKPEAHGEVPVADEGDRHQLDAHDEVGDHERELQMRDQ